jgi:hypothetical protein
MKQNYDGCCHCGRIRFKTSLDLEEAIVCDCSICTMKGSIVVRVEEADFDLLTPVGELSPYTFNKHIAKHYFCPVCGIHPFHRPRSYPDLWAVNIRCLAGETVASVKPRQVFGSKLD